MDIYFKKRDQMRSPARPSIVDANAEIEKKRSASPVVNKISVGGPVVQKVVYKADLDLVKKQVDDIQEKVNAKLAEVSASIEKLSKSSESVKCEELKKQLSESVKKQNENITSLASELVSQLDKLNEINSRLASVEDHFE